MAKKADSYSCLSVFRLVQLVHYAQNESLDEDIQHDMLKTIIVR